MENVWENFLNLIFQTDATIECIFDVHQSCGALNCLFFCGSVLFISFLLLKYIYSVA